MVCKVLLLIWCTKFTNHAVTEYVNVDLLLANSHYM